MKRIPEQLLLFPSDIEKVIRNQVEKYGLPAYAAQHIKELMNKPEEEHFFRCCHSGCELCRDDLKNCLYAVKKQLEIEKSLYYS
ncbi:MAG: hypothetical protein H7A25_19645 [Leptospiraceae bacterium]|nr:hypothetical protein [Leptospiraceae bacterium]MCP5502121.1 hypothetical protein [Leptospiraceae bacterium]